MKQQVAFDEQHSLELIRHYLPSQAALKDFIHHNPLHSFQHLTFHEALWQVSNSFGYSTYLSINEYRDLNSTGTIKSGMIDKVIEDHYRDVSDPILDRTEHLEYWRDRMLKKQSDKHPISRLNQLRNKWKDIYQINMDKAVHPLLFRILSAFLDQGISMWNFPVHHKNFLKSIRSLEENGIVSIFKNKRASQLLLNENTKLCDLLKILVGSEEYFEHYLLEQQFVHPGWSGFVSYVESNPETLLSFKEIHLHDLIYLELLLEIDTLDVKFGTNWHPLSDHINYNIVPLFDRVDHHEISTVLKLWQEAYEWSYFDSVLEGISKSDSTPNPAPQPSFQGLFCIDDREYSFRRNIELVDSLADTYGTPGYFGVEFYFKPEHSKFNTKACPAPVTPAYLIKERNRKIGKKYDPHHHNYTHSLMRAWLLTSVLGFWSFIKLVINLFKPSLTASTAYSFHHMDKDSKLEIESNGEMEQGLQLGFTVEEMVVRVTTVLKSIGLISNFSKIIYVVGHGGSSVNNPYYAGYDCGACCGRPGAVNARVFAFMANHKKVREKLKLDGVEISDLTIFIGAMHDTTRDEIEFYDEATIPVELRTAHKANKMVFEKALLLNAKERSLRFDNINKSLSDRSIHNAIKKRSLSLFEPRPEWNHTDNALCIIGRKNLYSKLYLDKRPFINSYDYSQDVGGAYLRKILEATIPVCGGINLEYYFSRVDQQNFGSGTKLPHNVVGLFAVNNGIDGDLRPGLPSQMIETHVPVRLLFIIEQVPEIVLGVFQSSEVLYEWIQNEWVLLCAKNPENNDILRFRNGKFHPYSFLESESEPTPTTNRQEEEKEVLLKSF